LLQEDFYLFSVVFNVNAFGFWEHENYVLIQNQSLEEIAQQENISLETLTLKKKYWEEILYAEREKRSKPRLDDKCLTSWNAIMLKGYVEVYKATGNKNYLNIALRNADYIIKNCWTSEGNLKHSYKNGTRGGAEQSEAKATINGFLEDYAHVIQAFISLYEVTFDENWLQNAKQLTDYTFDYFYDDKAQFFSFTSHQDDPLITNLFEVEDNVIPASNSVMAEALYKLSIYFENSYYEKICRQMVQNIVPTVDYPSAFSNWLNVLLHFSEHNKELAICGINAIEYLEKLNKNYLPNIIIAGNVSVSKLPFLENRFSDKETLFYLCQNKTCQKPLTDFEEIRKEIPI
jgi:uncharacterized protein YyaL (SSP411 family)